MAEKMTLQRQRDEQSCTCHPDDNPPRPCPRKYALTECRRAALAQSTQGEVVAWVVVDGGSTGENRFRTIRHGMPAWTLDQADAVQFARREDAERFAEDDDDAWGILQVNTHAERARVPADMVLVPEAPTTAMIDAASDAWRRTSDTTFGFVLWELIYKAMLAAAPSQPAEVGNG